ncbi:cilia- and flagella-associated protein 276 isoform X2 [Lampris incognitus]|uniref:cilia- and flagella-associated protein 276 isoform X2 n=1 Tax=Lampris incognitus TaxID=2546036 RepID=UPI0024B61AD5|nr:cilia- and flagella-associated protein 276 isoform X2 [Lampris incognitus]
MSQRDPFPFPKFENDNTFTGVKQQQRGRFDIPTHLAQNEEPWSRLHDAATLTSARRNVLHYDQQDSLDFNLKSVYDHHKEFLRTKPQSLYQRETVYEDHGRKLKNCEKQDVPQSDLEKDIRVWVNPQRCSIHNIKGSIESHHNASTNRGYSRKHDGGFYSP